MKVVQDLGLQSQNTSLKLTDKRSALEVHLGLEVPLPSVWIKLKSNLGTRCLLDDRHAIANNSLCGQVFKR